MKRYRSKDGKTFEHHFFWASKNILQYTGSTCGLICKGKNGTLQKQIQQCACKLSSSADFFKALVWKAVKLYPIICQYDRFEKKKEDYKEKGASSTQDPSYIVPVHKYTKQRLARLGIRNSEQANKFMYLDEQMLPRSWGIIKREGEHAIDDRKESTTKLEGFGKASNGSGKRCVNTTIADYA